MKHLFLFLFPIVFSSQLFAQVPMPVASKDFGDTKSRGSNGLIIPVSYMASSREGDFAYADYGRTNKVICSGKTLQEKWTSAVEMEGEHLHSLNGMAQHYVLGSITDDTYHLQSFDAQSGTLVKKLTFAIVKPKMSIPTAMVSPKFANVRFGLSPDRSKLLVINIFNKEKAFQVLVFDGSLNKLSDSRIQTKDPDDDENISYSISNSGTVAVTILDKKGLTLELKTLPAGASEWQTQTVAKRSGADPKDHISDAIVAFDGNNDGVLALTVSNKKGNPLALELNYLNLVSGKYMLAGKFDDDLTGQAKLTDQEKGELCFSNAVYLSGKYIIFADLQNSTLFSRGLKYERQNMYIAGYSADAKQPERYFKNVVEKYQSNIVPMPSVHQSPTHSVPGTGNPGYYTYRTSWTYRVSFPDWVTPALYSALAAYPDGENLHFLCLVNNKKNGVWINNETLVATYRLDITTGVVKESVVENYKPDEKVRYSVPFSTFIGRHSAVLCVMVREGLLNFKLRLDSMKFLNDNGGAFEDDANE